ncbi:MAG: glycine/betaine ABC transporter substrate-binding protein [Deltaproteobacteria bacterium HGW-Deltaproteobacteria-18]|jgi:glycine betaine/proline transport system substrate-binding protein|nr:MAG: glycine/betaine ABC transporter substrate-binding protein [Deltaproteobacteria bacterium HGW-Deltaproteobacteria-18]
MRFLKALVIVAAVCLIPANLLANPIRFGVPPWPGVTVKTEVVCQILNAMGHETNQLEIGPPVIYKGLTAGDVDAYVAAWIPQQNGMFIPLKENKAIDIIRVNVDQADTGLAVPTYVWDAGVRSVADLDKHADKFDRTIFGIEVGSGMHTSTEEMISNDVAGLGDWELVGSTTPVMLTAVDDRVRQNKWAVFHAWRPHWMTLKIDMKFLEGVPGSEKLISSSVVYTVASNDFAEKYPQARAFLSNFYVPAEIQSAWIYAFGFEKKDPVDVARTWIAENPETVAKWLEGVLTVDGKPAFDAVRDKIK